VPQGSVKFHREYPGEILADAPSRRRDVQGITRRIGDRTALAGRRERVRGAAFEVWSTEFSRVPQHAIRVSPHAHNRPSPGRAVKFATGDLHWPEPASGGNGWFWFPLVRVQPDSIQLCSNLDEEFGCFLAVEGNFFRPRFPRLGQCGLFSGGPQKSRRGFTTTTSDRTVPRDTTYDFRRGPSPIRRRTFLAWTQ